MPPYSEWGRQGLPPWVPWVIIGGLAAVIAGLLIVH